MWALKAVGEGAVAGHSGLEGGASSPPGGPAEEADLEERPSECSHGCTLLLSVCQRDLDTKEMMNHEFDSANLTANMSGLQFTPKL